ncbi:MAG: hypothetical protein M3Q75_03870 [Gemmatimonadota bacterium]|nr:hypothetical protein [Gemmatimonadota bacterium]
MPFANVRDEAETIADRIKAWLDEDVPPSEIAVVVRQQPHLVCEHLIAELMARGIASQRAGAPGSDC